jgi:50S ribosomal subunit-associated GTPase HflX
MRALIRSSRKPEADDLEAWVANKMDELAAEENLKTFKKKVKKTPVLLISAAFDQGMTEFKQLIRDAVEEAAGDEVKLQAKLTRKDKKRAKKA